MRSGRESGLGRSVGRGTVVSRPGWDVSPRLRVDDDDGLRAEWLAVACPLKLPPSHPPRLSVVWCRPGCPPHLRYLAGSSCIHIFIID